MQVLRLQVSSASTLPVVDLKYAKKNLYQKIRFIYYSFICKFRCKFQKFCLPANNLFNINPDSEIIIDGQCKQGCAANSMPSYKYKIYYGVSTLNDMNFFNFNWNEITYLSSYAIGKNSFIKFF